jgi:nucleoside-diphosphate-sugar epimerase
MTILLTGSHGFIGSRVKALLADRDAVCFRGDLRDPESYAYALKALRLTACIHCAWLRIPDLEEHAWENLNASARFLSMLPMSCLTIGAGSCFEYGDAQGAVTEDMVSPKTEFAKAKVALSASVDRWARIFYAYPNRLTREASDHYGHTKPISVAMASGKTKWFPPGSDPDWHPDHPERACDFIHVDDVARGLVALLDADCEAGAYNLGSGQPRAVGEVCNAIARRCGKEEPYPGIKATSGFWADQTKTFAATGWKVEVPFEP